MPKLLCDLHIHSCLSPCGDNEMTPYNLVNLARIMGLDLIALTDHNSSLNCPGALDAAKEAGITVVPGMELTTSEEVHVVCLFPELPNALAFSDYVSTNMPKVKNRLDLFGEQIVMDHLDGVLSMRENLLSVASYISISSVCDVIKDFDGVCYPAHVDRPAFSLIANLGGFSSDMSFANAEISKFADEEKLKQEHPALKDMRIIRASDAHILENISAGSTELDLPENSARALIEFLKTAKK
ncbi:MAG: PHP domain-containing protein [Clostridia bacterium]|nr:PHP domain-containing protein [Clostridia bacterium]